MSALMLRWIVKKRSKTSCSRFRSASVILTAVAPRSIENVLWRTFSSSFASLGRNS